MADLANVVAQVERAIKCQEKLNPNPEWRQILQRALCNLLKLPAFKRLQIGW